MTRRRVIGTVLVGLIRVTIATTAFAQVASARPAVAVADVAVTPGGWTLPPPQLGSTIVDLLIGELVSSQQFHIYDGQWLVPEEQLGGHVDLQRLRQAASMRHVDYLVLGSVTAFGTERSRRRGGGILPRPMAMGGFSREAAATSVAITFRVVDVRTGEIVTTATGQGVGRRHSTGLALLGLIRGLPLPLAAAGAARSINARDAMLDEALRTAVHDAAQALAMSATRLSGDPGGL